MRSARFTESRQQESVTQTRQKNRAQIALIALQEHLANAVEGLEVLGAFYRSAASLSAAQGRYAVAGSVAQCGFTT